MLLRLIFGFIFFGLLFYAIYTYAPDTFAVLVSWAAKIFDWIDGLIGRVSSHPNNAP